MSNTIFEFRPFRQAVQVLLSDSRQSVEPLIVPEPLRDVIRDGLERALLDPEALADFVRYLDSINTPRSFRPRDLEPFAKLTEVVQNGLGCLDVHELAVLVLSPFQLRDIQEAIDEHGLSDYWWSVATRFQPKELEAIVEPRRESVQAYQSPALTTALDDSRPEPAAAGLPDRSDHWNEESSLGNAEFLAIHDVGRADRAKATIVIVSFHLFPDRESGTLEVNLSQPLSLSGSATCSAKLWGSDKKILEDNQGSELSTASTTAQSGCLRFTGIGPVLGKIYWLEVEYRHPDRFHLRLLVPFRTPPSGA